MIRRMSDTEMIALLAMQQEIATSDIARSMANPNFVLEIAVVPA